MSAYRKLSRSSARVFNIGATTVASSAAVEKGSPSIRSGTASVHRQSVSRSTQQLEATGLPGLKKAGRAGRKPRLSAADLKKIEQGLKRGPEAPGYETNLWTAWRVAHLIEQECGVRYHSSRA